MLFLSMVEASMKLNVPPTKADLGDDCKDNSFFNVYVFMFVYVDKAIFAEVRECPFVALLDKSGRRERK